MMIVLLIISKDAASSHLKTRPNEKAADSCESAAFKILGGDRWT
ncbi:MULTISPECIES: hypothetical protein [unclassified Duganella]|nr:MULTISPECIES: hypothetical protein [unclassified Duganella]